MRIFGTKLINYQSLVFSMVLKTSVIREIRRLRKEEKLPIRKIGAKLNISPTSVARYLDSEENTDYKKNGLATPTQKSLEFRQKEEKKTPEEIMDTFLIQMYKDDIKFYTELLRIRKIGAKSEEKPKPEKIPYFVDGVTLKVTFQEFLAWKQFESEQKTARLEREERREELERRRAELEEGEWRRKDEERREDAKRKNYLIAAAIYFIIHNNTHTTP